MQYTVDYFIKKFEAIPEHLWCTHTRALGEQRCALGWCYLTKESALHSETCSSDDDSDEDKALRRLFIQFLGLHLSVGYVNNGLHEAYQQLSPRQRVLAVLYDIKKIIQPKSLKVIIERRHCIGRSYMDIHNCPLCAALEEQYPLLGFKQVGGDHVYSGYITNRTMYFNPIGWNLGTIELLQSGEIEKYVLELFDNKDEVIRPSASQKIEPLPMKEKIIYVTISEKIKEDTKDILVTEKQN